MREHVLEFVLKIRSVLKIVFIDVRMYCAIFAGLSEFVDRLADSTERLVAGVHVILQRVIVPIEEDVTRHESVGVVCSVPIRKENRLHALAVFVVELRLTRTHLDRTIIVGFERHVRVGDPERTLQRLLFLPQTSNLR